MCFPRWSAGRPARRIHPERTRIAAMKHARLALLTPLVVLACAATESPLDDYVEVTPTTKLDAPTAAGVAPRNREAVARGEYLVELLGCGVCHTDGALEGRP